MFVQFVVCVQNLFRDTFVFRAFFVLPLSSSCMATKWPCVVWMFCAIIYG